MNRGQFYPNSELWKKLNDEAAVHGVSVSQLVTDILENFYGLNNQQSVTNLTEQVYAEVAQYVSQHSAGDRFDLLTASDTFRNIQMVSGKKPRAVRASIGRSFAASIGKGIFHNVKKAKEDGKQVLSANNALTYEVS